MVALIDPSKARADAALKVKRESFVLSAYKDTIVYPTFADFVANMQPHQKPQGVCEGIRMESVASTDTLFLLAARSAIWVGSPPAYRGSEQPGRDLERHLVEAFPNVGIFIEKPVSTGPVDQAQKVAQLLEKSGNMVSVGYMLRYLKVVQKMKQILEENNLKVMATNARYIWRTSTRPRLSGGTRPRRVDLSWSRRRTFAICRATLVARWTCLP